MTSRGVFVRLEQAQDYLPPNTHQGFVEAKMLLNAPPSTHFKVTYSVLKPGGAAREHIHHWDHAYYILSGKARIKVGSDEKTVGQDSLVYVPPGTLHSVTNLLDEPLVVLAIVGPESVYRLSDK